MENKILVGRVVTLDSSTGPIDRVVVRDLGEIVLVCRADEYKKAEKEGREPVSVGFKRTDILLA